MPSCTATLPGHHRIDCASIRSAIATCTTHNVRPLSPPLRVDGVMGAFFLIRRSVIPPPTLFDEDFFLFFEDTALAHTLRNRRTPCFLFPGATITHIGGKSRSPSSVSFFFDSKYLYLRKFYGSLHSKGIYFMDRARILRKWSLYSLFSLVSASERIKFKQRYYGGTIPVAPPARKRSRFPNDTQTNPQAVSKAPYRHAPRIAPECQRIQCSHS